MWPNTSESGAVSISDSIAYRSFDHASKALFSRHFAMSDDSLFGHFERQFGKDFADEMRSGCRTWLILFAIASAVIVIAGWSIWNTLNG